MKITIYELLGLIKNGKAPKEIEFNGERYIYDNEINDYEKINETEFLFDFYNATGILTDELKIIEEVEDKEYEDIGELKIENIYKCDDYQQIYINFKETWNKINALIKNQKKIMNELKNK